MDSENTPMPPTEQEKAAAEFALLKTTTAHVVKQMDHLRESRTDMKMLAETLQAAVAEVRVAKDPEFATYLREYMGYELARVIAKERS